MKKLFQKTEIQTLEELGISPSPQRIAIFRYLREHPVHPTAEKIFSELREALPTLSLTTVYNTLTLLAKKKAIRTVIIEDGELRYDADLRDHGHFKCMKCGHVFDLFPSGSLLNDLSMIGLPSGFEVSEVHLCMKGCCPECRKSFS